MDVISLLKTIRLHESKLLYQISELSHSQPSLVASYMNVEFADIRELKCYSKHICNQINNAFEYNTSSLFTIDFSAFTDKALEQFCFTGMNDDTYSEPASSLRYTEEQRSAIEKLRLHQHRIFCTFYELAKFSPTVAVACCGLSQDLINKLANINIAQLNDLIEEFPEVSFIKLRIKKKNGLKKLHANLKAEDAFALYLDAAIC